MNRRDSSCWCLPIRAVEPARRAPLAMRTRHLQTLRDNVDMQSYCWRSRLFRAVRFRRAGQLTMGRWCCPQRLTKNDGHRCHARWVVSGVCVALQATKICLHNVSVNIRTEDQRDVDVDAQSDGFFDGWNTLSRTRNLDHDVWSIERRK